MKCKWPIAVLLLFTLAACDVDIDAPETPTIAASPTQDETAIARLATKTPTLTFTPSSTATSTATDNPTETATSTSTSTLTQTPSATPTLTLTATDNPTATATLTNTRTPTATGTATPTHTLTASPTWTMVPTRTPTLTATPTQTDTPTQSPSRTASPTATQAPTFTASPTDMPRPSMTPTRTTMPTVTLTPPPSATPTESIARLDIPTATPRATSTFTPFPSITPNQTATWEAEHMTGPTPTRTPGGIYTLAPTATPPPTITPRPEASSVPSGEGTGTFYDPNAPPANQEALPVAPEGETGPAGPTLPEQQYIVVSYVGQVVPLLDVPNMAAGTSSSMAQGEVFAISRGGQVAAIGYDRTLYVNGQPVIVSPASEFGLHENLSYGDLVWSPDGQRLAMRVDAADPGAFNGIDSGIWIYEPATNRSWQIFRSTYQGAQASEQRRAVTVHWAPNGGSLIVTVDTPLGRANVLTPVDHDANQFINALPYANATWAPDSSSVIVSGYQWGVTTVVGRVALDANWTYTEYLNQSTSGLVMQYAIELYDGRIAFLAGETPDSFALYVIQPTPGVQAAIRISQVIPGQIMSAEWNADRTAALIIAQAGNGRRLWIVRTDGTVQDITPGTGAPASAHWR